MKQKLTFLLTALLLLTGMTTWGQTREETVVYTLDGTQTGGSNGYATESEITQGSLTWMVMGNTTISPWRIGGKNLTNEIRPVYSTGTISDNISKIVVTHGTASDITVNAMTLIVSANSDFTNPTSTLSGTFAASSTTTFTRPSSVDWSGMYYKITYDVSVSGNNNKFVQFISAEFYSDGGGSQQETVATPTFSPAGGTYNEPQSVTISCATEGATICYTTDGSEPTENSQQYSIGVPLNINETTTLKAKAYKSGYTPSATATATYTILTLSNISDINAAGTYVVQGTIVAKSQRGFIVGDGTGYVYYYNTSYSQSSYNIGDMVRLSGSVVVYGGVYEFNNSTTVTEATSSNYVAEDPTVITGEEMDARVASTTPAQLSTYVQYVGTLTVSGNYYNITDIEGATTAKGSISYPISTDFTSLNGQEVVVTGYYVGVSSSQYYNTMIGSIEENVVVLPEAATPTFTPAAGTYLTAQNVTISCTTDDATIYYTTDGSEPTENSSVYSSPIAVNVSMTIKAMAAAQGYENSEVATAVYTINEPMTIAAARVLEDNAYACVEGTVIFLDGRNVYIQDETAGIDLYLNNNTVPSGLALGDKVRAYGSKTVFRGLVELTGIDGGDANVFTVISHNNTLPLQVKTIAEINSDYSGDNMLQSTRVKIEDAIIGAINTGGNTVLTQDGNSLNIYRIPTVDGLMEGDLVTVTGIIGCYNAVQLRVVSASDVQYSHRPALTANPTTLSGFTYDYEEGGPSEEASFLIGGNYLTGNVSIYPSESFEISPIGTFHPENPLVIYTPHSGYFYDITINVRMKAGLEAGTYEERLYAVSAGADTLFINVSGTVTGGTPTPPEPPTPGDGNYVRVSDLSMLTDGAFVIVAARFDSNANDYYAMTAATTGKPTGVLFTSATSGNDEVLPASITDEESTYYWVVGVTNNGYTFTNADGDLIGYSSSTNFSTGGDNTEWEITNETSGEGTMVPNYTGFVITNVNNNGRAFALNTSHNFGPYAKSNMTGTQAGNYNFYLDLFVKTEGGDPPTPTVATPTFTPEGGTYFEEQTVSIACTTEGATIYYSTESENGPWTEYSAPITVSESMTIWAYAEKENYNNSAVAMAEYVIQLGFVTIFNQDWEGEMNGWTFVDVEGEMEWNVATYQNNHYAYANGYNHGANEDWCISPAFNLDAYDNPTLSFRTATKFDGNVLQVMFSNDYDGEDPTEATWTELTCELSTGNYTWVESGDIDLSDFSGSECHIGFKYTCEADQAAAWEVDDILLVGQTSEPVVTVTPLALTGFTYTEGNGPSEEQSFTVSGLNLTSNVVIAEAADYEISLTSGDDFAAQSTLTLSIDNGTIEDAVIYVRLKADLTVGEYNDEDITITCDDVDDIVVTCSGSVTEQPVPGGDYVRISDVSQLAAGNRVIIAARYNDTEDAYLAAANTLTSGKLTTTEFTSVMNGDDEIIPASILDAEDSFYWIVDITDDGYTFTNANGDMIGYGSSTNLVMNGDKTVWTISGGVSAPESLVPEYFGFNIVNATTDTRAIALRVSNTESVLKAYATSNMTNGEYNFFLDIFMQGEGGVPPTPTVAAPTFTPGAGTYYETQDVTISCATPEATIYYSLESETGPWDEYEEAITVDENMTIWAYATKEGYNDSPVVSAEYIIQNDIVVIFNQDWEEDWNGWTEVLVEGDSLWRIASYQGNHYAYANGYNHPATEDWLISPAFDLDSYSDVVLTFRTANNYTGPELEVYFSNDYDGQDPTLATWVQLPCDLSTGSWNWVPSGDISLDEFNGSNCYIGYRYQCSDDEAAGWEVDDIMLVSGSAVAGPTLTATPDALSGLDYVEGEGPSDPLTYELTGSDLEGEGEVTVTVTEGFEISLDGEDFFETLYVQYADGELVDQPVTIYVQLMEGLEVGTYTGTITHEGGGATTEVSLTGTVHSEYEPAMITLMPYYIQGNNGSNNNRVPVAVAAYLYNLEPEATYRYVNQFVDANDGPETAGAGNVIYADAEGFYRSTSPSLSTEGGYGEFTTDEDGIAFVWFVNEPTANTRFTPGNEVYLRVRINDGNDGTTVENIFTSDDYATVINFGSERDEYQGTAFYAKSNEPAMTFAMLHANADDERPLYATSIETTGVDYGSINQYADFYKEEVAGNDGWFGGILPNDNEEGVNAIFIVDMESNILHQYETENGEWMPEAFTANPNGGLDEPIFIDLTDDGVDDMEANVTVWSANHEFVVENGDNAHYMMTVYNILGQPVMQKQVNAGSTERISHSLATGVYVIRLENNRNRVSVKVIVK